MVTSVDFFLSMFFVLTSDILSLQKYFHSVFINGLIIYSISLELSDASDIGNMKSL